MHGQTKHIVLGIDFFESSDPLIKGLLLIMQFNIMAGDEPNKGVLQESRGPD